MSGVERHPALRTRGAELFGVDYPIVQTGMGYVSDARLTAATSAAGGLGIIGSGLMSYDELATAIATVKDHTDRPFGVNFTLMPNRRYRKRMEAWLDIAMEEGVKFFLTSLGKPDWVVKRAHTNGIIVYHDVSKAKFAKYAIDAGVDGLNCVNNRGGGQTGRDSSSIADGYAEILASSSRAAICPKALAALGLAPVIRRRSV